MMIDVSCTRASTLERYPLSRVPGTAVDGVLRGSPRSARSLASPRTPPLPRAGLPGLVRGGRRVVLASRGAREAGSTQPATAARRAALALDLVARLLVLVVLVVEGELLVRLDPPDGEESDPRQRWRRVVHPDRVRPQVRLAAVVEEARDAARVVGVDRVLVVCPCAAAGEGAGRGSSCRSGASSPLEGLARDSLPGARGHKYCGRVRCGNHPPRRGRRGSRSPARRR